MMLEGDEFVEGEFFLEREFVLTGLPVKMGEFTRQFSVIKYVITC